MLTTIAGLLVAIWIVLQSQQPVSSTLSLIIGVIAGLLCLVDLIRPYAGNWGARRDHPAA